MNTGCNSLIIASISDFSPLAVSETNEPRTSFERRSSPSNSVSVTSFGKTH